MWLVYVLFNVDEVFLCYNQQAQNISAMWLALNRLTALALPVRYERIWSRKLTAAAIMLQYLLPAFFVSPMFFHGLPYFVDINNKTGVVAETPYDPSVPALMTQMGTYLIEFILIIAGICYALSIRAIWKAHHNHQATLSQSDAKRASGAREARFTIVSMVTFVLLALYYLRLESLSQGWNIIFYNIGTYAGDIRSFINPYTMYLVSKNVRDAVRYQLAIFIPPLRKEGMSNTNALNNQQTSAAFNNGPSSPRNLFMKRVKQNESTTNTNLTNTLHPNMAFTSTVFSSPSSRLANSGLRVTDLERY